MCTWCCRSRRAGTCRFAWLSEWWPDKKRDVWHALRVHLDPKSVAPGNRCRLLCGLIADNPKNYPNGTNTTGKLHGAVGEVMGGRPTAIDHSITDQRHAANIDRCSLKVEISLHPSLPHPPLCVNVRRAVIPTLRPHCVRMCVHSPGARQAHAVNKWHRKFKTIPYFSVVSTSHKNEANLPMACSSGPARDGDVP